MVARKEYIVDWRRNPRTLMPQPVIRTSPPMTTGHTSSQGTPIGTPEEVILSVTYAKISSNYLRDRAAEIQQAVNDLRVETVYCDRQPSTAWREALKAKSIAIYHARNELLREYRQYESESGAWAFYIKKGYEFESGGRKMKIKCWDEARDIQLAVYDAKKAVDAATKPWRPLPPSERMDIIKLPKWIEGKEDEKPMDAREAKELQEALELEAAYEEMVRELEPNTAAYWERVASEKMAATGSEGLGRKIGKWLCFSSA